MKWEYGGKTVRSDVANSVLNFCKNPVKFGNELDGWKFDELEIAVCFLASRGFLNEVWYTELKTILEIERENILF